MHFRRNSNMPLLLWTLSLGPGTYMLGRLFSGLNTSGLRHLMVGLLDWQRRQSKAGVSSSGLPFLGGEVLRAFIDLQDPSFPLLTRAMEEHIFIQNLSRNDRRGIGILVGMELISISSSGLLEPIDMENGLTPERIRKGLKKMPGVPLALAELERDPTARPAVIGRIVKEATGANWNEGTISSIGKNTRSWARKAGMMVSHERTRATNA